MNITFDLETLGNTSHAPIVQIGAVKFTDDGEITDTFIRTIDVEKLKKYTGFTVDYSTIQWWLTQDKEAIDSVFSVERKVNLRVALRDFMIWIGEHSKYAYWSHATFDPPILNYNMKVVDLSNSIPYKAHKDIRTLTHLVGKIEVERKGIHHNALDDCIFQAEYISKSLQKLKE